MTTIDDEDRIFGDCADCIDEHTAFLCSAGGRDAVQCPYDKSETDGDFNESRGKLKPNLLYQISQTSVLDDITGVSPTFFRNFLLSIASRFILDSKSDDRDKLYVDTISATVSSLKQDYKCIYQFGKSNKELMKSINGILSSAFLIGLVSDRNGLSPKEAELILRRAQSAIANDKKWGNTKILREKLRAIALDVVIFRRENNLRQVGITKKSIENFMKTDEYFWKKLSDADIDRGDISINLLLEVMSHAKKAAG